MHELSLSSLADILTFILPKILQRPVKHPVMNNVTIIQSNVDHNSPSMVFILKNTF